MEEKNKRRFKPVLKTSTAGAVDASPLSSTELSTPATQPTPLKPSVPKTVNASTQKGQKNQKVSDGPVKKITPRKKRAPPETASSVDNSTDTKPAVSPKTVPNTEGTVSQAVTQPASSVPSPLAVSGQSQASVAQVSTTVPTKTPKKRKSKTAIGLNTSNTGNNEIESKPKKAKKHKDPKDPNAPKKPANAYLLFSNIKRKEIKDKNPNVDAKGIITLIGEAWRKLSEEEKKPYKEMVEDAKKKYEEDMKAYNASMSNAAIFDKDQISTSTSPDQGKDNSNGYTSITPFSSEPPLVHENEVSTSSVHDAPIQNISKSEIELRGQQGELSQVSSQQVLSSIGDVSLVAYTTYRQQEQDAMEALLDMPDTGNEFDFRYHNMDIFDNYFIQYLNQNHQITTSTPSFVINIRGDPDSVNVSQHFSITQEEQLSHQTPDHELLLCQPYEPPAEQHGSGQGSESVGDQTARLYLFPPEGQTQNSIGFNQDAVTMTDSDYNQNSLNLSIEQNQNQISKEILVSQSFEPPDGCDSRENSKSVSDNQNANSSPIIIHNQEHSSVNLLLCQPFDPPNNTEAEISNTWYQDGNQYQDLPSQHSSHQYTDESTIFQQQMSQDVPGYQSEIPQRISHQSQIKFHHQEVPHQQMIPDSQITPSNFSQYLHQQGQMHQHPVQHVISKDITDHGTRHQLASPHITSIQYIN
ncbi:4486_t:CDS:2, partial [Acaulospora morrowiae]